MIRKAWPENGTAIDRGASDVLEPPLAKQVPYMGAIFLRVFVYALREALWIVRVLLALFVF